MRSGKKSQRSNTKSIRKNGGKTDDPELTLCEQTEEDRKNPLKRFRRSIEFSVEEEPKLPSSADFYTLDIEAIEVEAQAIENQMNQAKGKNDYLVHQLDELRSQCRRLRDILNHPQHVHEEVKDFFKSEFALFGKIFLLSWHGDKKMVNNLAILARKYCEHMAFLASIGDPTAITHVSQLAMLTTKTIASLTDEKAICSLKEVAKNQLAWPLMVSPHPFLGSRQPDWETLGLGKAFPFKLGTKRRFKLDTEVGRIAWKLWLHIFNLKNKAEAFLKEKHIDLANYRREKANATQRSLLDEVVLLPPGIQTRDDVDKWWKAAKRCLIETFPDPQKPDRLNVALPALNDLVTAPSHRKSEEKLRSRILSKLSEQFDSLAGFGGTKRKKETRKSSQESLKSQADR